MIREGTILPDGLGTTLKPLLPDWQIVRQPRPVELERALSQKGWHLFSMAGDIADEAIASNRENALRRALNKLCARASTRGFNAIEVVQVRMRKFLGIYWTRVTAKLRHVQEGPYLFKTTKQMAFEAQRIRPSVPTIQMAGRRLGRGYRQYKSM